MSFFALNDLLRSLDCYKTESQRACSGITFLLPSRRRFIPYSWLLHAELNQKQTELQLHYTLTLVTITGHELGRLHEAVGCFQLYLVRESPSSAIVAETNPFVSRIEISEKISVAP